MPVPFLGRLNVTEYAALIGSFLLVGLEAFIRIFTLALPPSLLQLCYGGSRRLFNRLTTPAQKRAEQRRKSVSASIRDACDFVDLCAMFGYTAEEHVVRTEDGYLLGLHRLAWRKGEEDTKVNRGPNSVKKKVVYLHHGLLMNSEVWVCLTDEQRCLPFVLVERGFDVWLGNNRGNKYSKKSIRCSPTTTEFWNFSIDQFALHDIPNSISYILEITGQPSLSYIGFSQGTAQAFASLSIHPKLNDQVNVFIALAPAMSPAGLSNGIVDALVKASPQVLYLLFGRRSILSSATMWQSILYPPLFTKMIDIGLSFLFNWRTENISTSQKLAAYPHLYSYTSTKSVVHWFQIIRTKSFQMYDDDVHRPLILASNNKYTKVAKYPTRNIKTPIVLVYGGSDSLVDIRAMLRELPRQTVANEIPHYEHLDFLWARDVDQRVFQHVFDALESFTGAEHTREEYERYRSVRRQHTSEIPKEFVRVSNRHLLFGGDDAATTADSDVSTAVGDEIGIIRVAATESDSDEATTIPEKTQGTATQLEPAPRITSNSSAHQMLRDTEIPSSLGNSRIARPRSKNPMDQGEDKTNAGNEDGSAAESPITPISSWNIATSVPAPDGGAGGAAVAGRRNITSQGPTTSGTGMMNMRTTPKRRSTGGSSISFESMKGGRGIALGASKAVGGVSTGLPDIESMVGSPSGGTGTGTGTGGTRSDEASRRKSLI